MGLRRILKRVVVLVLCAVMFFTIFSGSLFYDAEMDRFFDTLPHERSENDVLLYWLDVLYEQESQQGRKIEDPNNTIGIVGEAGLVLSGDLLYNTGLDRLKGEDYSYASYEVTAIDIKSGEVVRRIELPDFQMRTVEFAYHDGCFWIKDDEQSIKYDIRQDVVSDVAAEEEALAYRKNYAFEELPEASGSCSNFHMQITECQSGESRAITVEKIAQTSPAMQTLIEKYAGVTRAFAPREVFRFVFCQMQEVEGEIYLILLFNCWQQTFLPVLFHYDWENDSFSYCTYGKSTFFDYLVACVVVNLPEEA